jgi:hypothetical protein
MKVKQHFGGTYNVHFQGYEEAKQKNQHEEGDMFLQNVH